MRNACQLIPTANARRQAKQEQVNAKALNLKVSLKLKLTRAKPLRENQSKPGSLLGGFEDIKVHQIRTRILPSQTQLFFSSDSKVIGWDCVKVDKLVKFGLSCGSLDFLDSEGLIL